MDYSVNPWWVYALSITGVLVLVIGLPLWGIAASSRRSRRQSVSLEHGAVRITDSAFGGERVIPFERIDTVAYLPERESWTVTASPDSERMLDYRTTQARASGGGADLFAHGGLIILDSDGRMVGHLAYEVGSKAPIGTVWKQIPARDYVQIAPKGPGKGYSRAAFKKAYPRALRFGSLWGAARWLWTILAFVFVGLPVLAVVGVFIWAFVTTWIELYG